jgi:hypothetical protein
MTTDKDYQAGDLVCYRGSSRVVPHLVTRVGGGIIHFDYGLCGKSVHHTSEALSRPEFTVDMWVRPKTRYGTPGPKRIGKIADNRLVFDAMISRAPGREGEIVEQPCGSTKKLT